MRVLERVLEAARSVDPRAVDGALAVGLTAWAATEPRVFSDPRRAVVLLAMPLAIAWLRTAPLAVLALEVIGVILVPDHLSLPQGVALLLAGFSAAFYSDRRLVVAALLVVASGWLWAFGGTARIPQGLVPLVLVVPVWLAGTAMRRRELRAEASAERADRLEREREAALRAERARIARELHDVVTHSVSVMVLQTGAARQIMTKDEHRLRELLESVESSGRSALDELRRLLGLISDQDVDAPLSPQPGVSEIPELLDRVRHAGQPIELRVEGQPQDVSGGVGVAAYRIVQEALTNVLKHAAGAPCRIVLRWDAQTLELEIIDAGPRQSDARHGVHLGRGLAGMRERAAMYGGTLDAGPGPDHGYEVRARLPLRASGA